MPSTEISGTVLPLELSLSGEDWLTIEDAALPIEERLADTSRTSEETG
jgi:hypothetical protein